MGPHQAARGSIAHLRRGRDQHPRGEVHDQAPHGQEPLRRRGGRHGSAQALRRAPAPGRLRLRRIPDNAGGVSAPRAGGSSADARPTLSVVVPFLGDNDAAALCAANLGRLRLSPGDELIVADNTKHGLPGGAFDSSVRVVRAVAERSSYHARNAGARTAVNDWILFLDADCLPVADLVDVYLAPPPADGCGAIAGSIVGSPDQGAFVARYARARGFLNLAGGGE